MTSATGQHLLFSKAALRRVRWAASAAPTSSTSRPGFNNWDLALHKDTRITESMALQFRAEFFNVVNHAQFTD
jgi:hypothetical protein